MSTGRRTLAGDRQPDRRLVGPSNWSAVSVGAVTATVSFGIGAVCVLGEGVSDVAKLVGAAVLVAAMAWAAREPRVALLSCVVVAARDGRVGIAGFNSQIHEVALAASVLIVVTSHAGDTHAVPSEHQGATPDVLEVSR